MTEDELWKRVQTAVWEIVHIVNDTTIPMFNSDIIEKVQRALPPDEYVDRDLIERIITDYWSPDPDTFGPPDE